MAGIHRHRRFWDSQMFWLSFFLFLGTVLGTVFFNKMSAEMKSTLESWFSGILTSSEIVSADRYSLFVGVLKKAVCVDFIGNSDLPGSFCQNPVLRGSSLSGIYIRNRCLCVDDACGNLWDPALFRTCISAGILLYTGSLPFMDHGTWSRRMEKMKIRLWMMVFFMVLGIISEIFINPNFSALIFQLF